MTPPRIPERLIRKPEWAAKVAARFCVELGRRAAADSGCTVMCKPFLLRTCVLEVSREMEAEQISWTEKPDSAEGRVGLLMSSLRRLEVQGSINWFRFAVQLPDLATQVCLAAWERSPRKVRSFQTAPSPASLRRSPRPSRNIEWRSSAKIQPCPLRHGDGLVRDEADPNGTAAALRQFPVLA